MSWDIMKALNIFRKALNILTKLTITSRKIHLHSFDGNMNDDRAWYRTFKRIRFGFTAKLLDQTSSNSLESIIQWLSTRSLIALKLMPNTWGPWTCQDQTIHGMCTKYWSGLQSWNVSAFQKCVWWSWKPQRDYITCTWTQWHCALLNHGNVCDLANQGFTIQHCSKMPPPPPHHNIHNVGPLWGGGGVTITNQLKNASGPPPHF